MRLIAFLATAKPEAALAFYRDRLDCDFVEESDFSLVFTSGETMIRIQKVPVVPQVTHTALGWQVDDIEARMTDLARRGVEPVRFAGLGDDLGIWTAPDGARIGWIRDPDGNILSFTQFAS